MKLNAQQIAALKLFDNALDALRESFAEEWEWDALYKTGCLPTRDLDDLSGELTYAAERGEIIE